MKNIVSTVVLIAFSIVAHGECPDTKATQIEAEVKWAGGTTTCGVGISLLGFELSVFGPECPDAKIYYPSHQVCRGESNEGTYCRPAGEMRVTYEKCDCVELTILGTGVTIPSCECSDAGELGHVEDAVTATCPGHP